MTEYTGPLRGGIVVGDKTTAGGVVIEGCSTYTLYGKEVALNGHQINCPACGTIGRIEAVPPRDIEVVHGQRIAMGGDLCICGCTPPPRLISSNEKRFNFGFSDEAFADPAAVPWLIHAGLNPADFALPFDEQFLLQDTTGKPLVDTYYSVKLPDGKIVHGTTDSRGLTERYKTEGAKHIEVYLGHIGVKFPEPLAWGKTNVKSGSVVVAKSDRLGKWWQLSTKGLNFIKNYEKFEANMYDDATGNATVGYGHLIHYGVISGAASEKPFEKGISEADATQLLLERLTEFETAINTSIHVALHQKEYDALVAFAYNIGKQGAIDSKAVKAINMGMHHLAPDEMMSWNKGKDPKTHLLKELKGLTNRRSDEAKIFRNADYERSK